MKKSYKKYNREVIEYTEIDGNIKPYRILYSTKLREANIKLPNTKKLLYIGHAYHNKTKSSQFIQELLKTKYDITKYDFDPYNDSFEIFKQLDGKRFDTVVLWQIMPSIKQLKKYLSFDKIVFFPMYDGVGNMDGGFWSEYACCNIINFSKTLHNECLKRGFSSHYIQYFPKPISTSNMGDEKSVFLWQRINLINPNTVNSVIGAENIDHLCIHNAPDPKHAFVEPPEEFVQKTEITEWFNTKEDLLNHIQKSAIYFAPRLKEGIGISFLEAMAMGRCVIAPNNPTMNEYIENGKTGYLYDIEKPVKIELQNIREIQKNTQEYIEKGYNNWEKNKFEILKWIDKGVNPNKLKLLSYYGYKEFLKSIFSLSNEYNTNGKHKILRMMNLKISYKSK